jgi:hypothetical protein
MAAVSPLVKAVVTTDSFVPLNSDFQPPLTSVPVLNPRTTSGLPVELLEAVVAMNAPVPVFEFRP